MGNQRSGNNTLRKRLRISAIGIVLLVVLVGWSKRCEEFNYDIVQWLPYNETDQILIANSTNVDTLMVVSRTITHTDKYPIFSCCACINSYGIRLSSTNLAIQAFYFDTRSYMGSIISINSEDLRFNEHFDTYEINGIEYSEVLEYINYQEDQTKNFSRIYIARSIGIVSIVGSDDVWFISDFSTREIDPKKIYTSTEDC